MQKGIYLVTGASSGIGQATTWALASEGCTVIAAGRDENKLEKTQSKNPSLIVPWSGDLAKAEDARVLCEFVRAQMKSLKLPLVGIVNNAGIYIPGDFAHAEDGAWEKTFQTNMMSAVRVTRDLYNELKESTSSSIVNVSSTLGIRPVPQISAYSALKAAMINWSNCLALEWAPDKIRVNSICPGLVDTPIHGFHGEPDDSTAKLAAHGMQPLGRMGTPGEIADSIVFLLSEKSQWTTGSVLSVDGGIHL